MPTKKTGRSRGRPPKEPSPFGERPQLTAKQWLGLDREFHSIKDQWQSDSCPWRAPLHAVATAAGVTERAARGWRKDPEYLRGLGWLLSEQLSAKIAAGDSKEPAPKLTDQQRAARLHVFVKQNWTGPVQSPIDEKVYSSIDDYVGHLLAHGVMPWPGESVKKKAE